ncbi:MAG: dephospho-CoA kinase [Deltaproteobacteria bacterium]|nr:dephospho-CoA kinase [Deltaproteobacteria bacterium]
MPEEITVNKELGIIEVFSYGKVTREDSESSMASLEKIINETNFTKVLADLGAPVVDCDRISRMVLEPRKPAWEDIVAHFGNGILLGDETINRKKLREIIFNNPDKRKLSQILQTLKEK